MLCRLSYPHLQAIPFVQHLWVFATENSLESAGNCVRTHDWESPMWLQKTNRELSFQQLHAHSLEPGFSYQERKSLLGVEWRGGKKQILKQPPTLACKRREAHPESWSTWELLSLTSIKRRQHKDRTSAQDGIFQQISQNMLHPSKHSASGSCSCERVTAALGLGSLIHKMG